MDSEAIIKRAQLLIGISMVIASCGAVLVMVALLFAGWVLIDSRLRVQHIEGTRFTANDGKELREMIAVNREETLKNRQDILTNRKKGDEIMEILHRIEEKKP